MGLFSKRLPAHLVPIHPHNAANGDWIILLEASTIVGPSAEKLRVARATLERKVVKKYNVFLHARHFLVMDGYDPRIHALYFCPQLYKFDSDSRLIALQGEEIGKLVAQALEGGVVEKRPWYEPAERLPDQPVIGANLNSEFDTVVVDMPTPRNSAATG